MITIVNYGLGNIRAFVNVYERLNISVKVANNSNQLKEATKIILPGVGSFDHAMGLLNNSGMRETLDELVLINKLPVIGICVGMQMMAESSEEGMEPGLGWIKAKVLKFDVSKLNYKPHLPHMGWNNIIIRQHDSLLNTFFDQSRFYFLHSYYFNPENRNEVIAESEYGEKFCTVVKKHNIYGIQFHPEKSHHNGVQLLKNFSAL